MGRVLRLVLVLVGGPMLAVGCSDDDAATSATSATGSATSTIAEPSTSGALPGTSSPTVASSASVPPAGPASSATIPAATIPVVPTGPTVAEAGGWRLAVTEPMAGDSIGPRVVLCYEVAGTSREPVVALEVTLLSPGSATDGDPVRVDASVGRGSVEVELAEAPPGRYDGLRVQLIADGARVDGVAVTIPAVALSAGAPSVACP